MCIGRLSLFAYVVMRDRFLYILNLKIIKKFTLTNCILYYTFLGFSQENHSFHTNFSQTDLIYEIRVLQSEQF